VTDSIAVGARATARRQAPQHRASLATAVERTLQNQRGPNTYLDPNALGSLIVPPPPWPGLARTA
jgi:hypothetical protein